MGKRNPDSKQSKLAAHLLKYKSINTLDANSLYSISRLSAAIFNLRYERQWHIESVPIRLMDKSGKAGKYVKYVLRSTTISKKQKPKTKFLKRTQI